MDTESQRREVDFEKEEIELNGCMKFVAKIQEKSSEFVKENKKTIKTVVFVILLLLFVAYFITAIVKVSTGLEQLIRLINLQAYISYSFREGGRRGLF